MPPDQLHTLNISSQVKLLLEEDTEESTIEQYGYPAGNEAVAETVET